MFPTSNSAEEATISVSNSSARGRGVVKSTAEMAKDAGQAATPSFCKCTSLFCRLLNSIGCAL